MLLFCWHISADPRAQKAAEFGEYQNPSKANKGNPEIEKSLKPKKTDSGAVSAIIHPKSTIRTAITRGQQI